MAGCVDEVEGFMFGSYLSLIPTECDLSKARYIDEFVIIISSAIDHLYLSEYMYLP